MTADTGIIADDADDGTPSAPAGHGRRGGSVVLLGARLGIPIAISFFLFGIAFGTVAVQRGWSPEAVVAMSLLVYSGSTQFILIDFARSPDVLVALVSTVLMLNFRNVLMAVTVRDAYLSLPPAARLPAMHFLTDETWALANATGTGAAEQARVILGAGLVSLAGWGAGTFLGATLGAVVTDPERFGLDFAYTGVFLFIVSRLWRGRVDALPWAVAAAVSLLGVSVLPGKWHIVAGALAGATCGAWVEWKRSRSS